MVAALDGWDQRTGRPFLHYRIAPEGETACRTTAYPEQRSGRGDRWSIMRDETKVRLYWEALISSLLGCGGPSLFLNMAYFTGLGWLRFTLRAFLASLFCFLLGTRTFERVTKRLRFANCLSYERHAGSNRVHLFLSVINILTSHS